MILARDVTTANKTHALGRETDHNAVRTSLHNVKNSRV